MLNELILELQGARGEGRRNTYMYVYGGLASGDWTTIGWHKGMWDNQDAERKEQKELLRHLSKFLMKNVLIH